MAICSASLIFGGFLMPEKNIYFDTELFEKEEDETFLYEQVGVSNGFGAKQLFKGRTMYENMHPSNDLASKGEVLDEFFSYPTSVPENIDPLPINFWNARTSFYGRMDKQKNIIVPKDFHLKQITAKGNNGEGIFVLNFVADAFEDFMYYVNIEKGKKLEDDGNVIKAEMKPHRGIEFINDKQQDIATAHYNAFESFITQSKSSNQKIRDFGSFVDQFLNVYGALGLRESPITKTGLMTSNRIGPRVSGLCIELSDKNQGDDKEKIKYFISENYQFYIKAAAQYGFIVDKNAPWRIVANLNSPKLKPYIDEYFRLVPNSGQTKANADHYHTYDNYSSLLGENNSVAAIKTNSTVSLDETNPVPPHTHDITKSGVSIAIGMTHLELLKHTHDLELSDSVSDWTESDVYNKFYDIAMGKDIEEVKVLFMNLWNEFVYKYPTVSYPTACYTDYYRDGNVKTKVQVVERKPFRDLNEFTKSFGDLFWLKTYLLIRLVEMGKSNLINSTELNSIMSDINQLYYFLDKETAIDYIGRYLKRYY